ncbi:DNA-binding protein [Bacteroides sp. 519]|uniref:HU family DNA-binding protein n=1 Tax=Bacteroides sp. 519 TaxID=2302937 RepID=UPI0013D39588|nr:DNA-binding protein [Bacteroides sp. 519]NDV57670.1 DNA-binding protein [Bacteroides sp. 519]
MSIPVQRYRRNKILGDQTSPELFYLKPVAGQTRVYSIDDVAAEAETVGALSAEDMVHAMKSFIRSLRKILVRGDKVKIEGLGTFHTTFNCIGAEEEKDCTVKNIRKVNVRFSVDNTLRLVNESNATTRAADNNVSFYIKGETVTSSGGNSGGGDDSGGGWIDPTA